MIESAKNAVTAERAATSFVLEHLFEIEKRRLHIEAGYSSLHEFAVAELTKRVESKSARAAEQELRKIVPAFLPRRDGIKIKDTAHALITAEVTVSLEAKLRQLRARHAHTHGGASLGELLELAVDLALKAGDAKRSDSKSTSTSKLEPKNTPHPEPFTRYIPAKYKRDLFKTQPHCQFVSALTQRQCKSTFALERDHIHPIAKGGKSTLENIQTLCRSHNQWKGARSITTSSFDSRSSKFPER